MIYSPIRLDYITGRTTSLLGSVQQIGQELMNIIIGHSEISPSKSDLGLVIGLFATGEEGNHSAVCSARGSMQISLMHCESTNFYFDCSLILFATSTTTTPSNILSYCLLADQLLG